MTRAARCEVLVDGEALRHNAVFLRSHLDRAGQRRAKLMAVVKACAYGHGVANVVPALRGVIDAFAVANLGEAFDVRAFAPHHPIFLLSPCLPGELQPALEAGVIPALSTAEEAHACAALVRGRDGTPRVATPIHLVVDTGMGRIGVWQEDAANLVKEIRSLRDIEIAYISTHLPMADEDAVFTSQQLKLFENLISGLRPLLPAAVVVHALNSAGILGFPGSGEGMVRAGLALYGCAPLSAWQDRLRQAMTWRARVVLVREMGSGRGISYGRTYITSRPMRVATLAVGYADGYPRHLGGAGAQVLLHGCRCDVLGRVTMDQIMVDVTHVPQASPGDCAVLMGRDGTEHILASELARKAGTIAWEIFCNAGCARRRVESL